MLSQTYGPHGNTAIAEYPIFITRDVAAAGGRRSMRFHGTDGRERVLAVDIPPGVTTGTRVLVNLDETEWDTLSCGQLAIVVTVVPHHVCECRGADLYMTLWVDRGLTLQERQIEVPIGEGRSIAVPLDPTATHGRFVYPGHGLLRGYAPRRSGDLVLRLQVVELDEPAGTEPALSNAAPPSWWQALLGARG
jgi:DnaJ-class molecular chaperone